MLKKMKLSKKIFISNIILIIVFGSLLTCFYPIIVKMNVQTKKQKVYNLVESAAGILEYYHDQVKNGRMKLQDAQVNATQVMSALRYDAKNYFWINDYDHNMVMHPFNKDLIGKNQEAYQDAKGKYLFREIVQVAKDKGGGFIEYFWTKPNDKVPSHKISYVKGFQPWGWVIGTGLYTEDVDQELAEATKWLGVFAGAAIAVTIGCLIITMLVTRGITRPIDRIIEGLSGGAGQVSAASGQVSSSSQQLAEGASEQAASLEETSSSIEELNAMTKHNAQNAEQAQAMMGEAQRIVKKVSVDMQNMVHAIDTVLVSSEETGKIIKTIDEIAFQTNLLALNAAVEAARAGEAGAGFAVVAEEVRNLAMRAAEAAKNTSGLIENTVKSVQNGNELTKYTQETFKEIVEVVNRIGVLIAEISEASQGQSNGIEQINRAIAAMNQVTQKSAASAEELAGASEEMDAQALQLRDFIGKLTRLINGRTDNNDVSAVQAGFLGSRSDGQDLQRPNGAFISDERSPMIPWR